MIAEAVISQIRIRPVILCGGSGTRLWPLSRSGFPKQFLSLTGNESLFQLACRRLMELGAEDIHVERPIIVTGEEHRFLALEQIREINIESSSLLLEPVGKNTAPALTLAALQAMEEGEDPVLVVTPADQTVVNEASLTEAMHVAIRQADSGSIVMLGVIPAYPATGYGYIQAESFCLQKTLNGAENLKLQTFNVRRFVEKPDIDNAQLYLDSGSYFWNAGIFLLKASVWLEALEAFRPDIVAATRLAWSARIVDTNPATLFVRPGKAEFMSIPPESIDYAVMEYCPSSHFQVKMVPLDAGWSDLGAWDAVWEVLPKDQNGNAYFGDVLMTDSHNTLAHASSRLVSLVGVSNLIVIETPDAILVADKSRSQNVKNIVNELQASGREEQILHRKVHRPWGWYDSIDYGLRFKVKRILVKPGASLSLQKHHHRAEHWIVVKGTAEITNGDKTLLLTENQSTYIPLGELHRLSNPGNIPLEIIEVQSGSYLREDDIVRFEDTYGRDGE